MRMLRMWLFDRYRDGDSGFIQQWLHVFKKTKTKSMSACFPSSRLSSCFCWDSSFICRITIRWRSSWLRTSWMFLLFILLTVVSTLRRPRGAVCLWNLLIIVSFHSRHTGSWNPITFQFVLRGIKFLWFKFRGWIGVLPQFRSQQPCFNPGIFIHIFWSFK